MAWLQLRPTFAIPLEVSREHAMERLDRVHRSRPNTERFLLTGEYGELHLPREEHRLWSPHLSFYVHGAREHCRILGRFAPRPDVWTTVWIGYLAFVCLAFFSALFAASQWFLGQNPWAAWITLGALVHLALIFATAHFGQQRSADQMERLRRELDEILQDAALQPADGGSR